MSVTVATGSTTRLEAWGTTHLVDAPGEYLARLTDGTMTTGVAHQVANRVGVGGLLEHRAHSVA